MEIDTADLRDSLIRSLQHEPLLVEAEMSLHASDEQHMIDEFRSGLVNSLHSAPPLAKVQREAFRDLNDDLIEQFRSAMRAAVRSGDNLAMSEKELLSALDLEKLGEFRSQLDTHLESDPEVSQEDLAIYVPAGFGLAEEFRRRLQPASEVEPEEIDKAAIRGEPEHRPAQPYAPGAYVALGIHADHEVLKPDADEDRSAQPFAPGAYVDRVLHIDQAEPVLEEPDLVKLGDDPRPERADATLVVASLRAGLKGTQTPQSEDTADKPTGDVPVLRGLTAVPILTAALEAIGPAKDDFGFIVRYGRYAPEGRRSEFVVGGLGFSELSRRLTSWLDTRGSLDDQVQVLDEGSGELTIYLLPAEKQY